MDAQRHGEGEGKTTIRRMTPLQKRRVVVYALLTVVLIGVLLFFCLPVYVESVLIPKWAAGLGLPHVACDVRRIGLGGADIGFFTIGEGDRTVLSVDAVQVDYSLVELAKGRIKKADLSGLKVFCRYGSGGFTIPGLDVGGVLEPIHSGKEASRVSQPVAVLPFGEIELRNAVLVCEWDGHVHRLPIELHIVPEETENGRLVCTLRLYPRNQQVSAVIHIDLNDKAAVLRFDANGFQLEPFVDVVRSIPGLGVWGAVNVGGTANVRLDPFELVAGSVSCETVAAGVSYQGLKAGAWGPQEAEETRTAIHIEGRGSEWEASVSSFLVGAPLPVKVANIHSRFTVGQETIAGSGAFVLSIDSAEGVGSHGVILPSPLASQGRFSMSLSKTAGWTLDVGTVNDGQGRYADVPRWKCVVGGLEVSSKAPVVAVSGRGGQADGTVTLTATVADLSVAGPKMRATIPLTAFTGSVPLGGSGNDVSQLRLNLSDAEVLVHSLRAKVRQAEGVGQLEASEGGGWRLGGILKIADGRFVPATEGLALGGNFSLVGRIVAGEANAKSSLETSLTDGLVVWKEHGFKVEGLNVGLLIADLMEVRSAPMQHLYFRQASFGAVTVEEGDADFQIASSDSVVVERGRVQWCGGQVHVEAMQISPAKKSYEVVLYCDRLNLATVLEQLGAAQAKGDGTVSGRIPLRIENGRLIFGNGFLFSSPGDGGTIRLRGTEALTKGIPPGTPQYIQFALAEEALKDFEYKWAKVTLMTEGNDLVAHLELDGKPAQPLPFVFNKELGFFARAEAGSQGSVFQGIKLDVNFRLPINQLLHYGDAVGRIVGGARQNKE